MKCFYYFSLSDFASRRFLKLLCINYMTLEISATALKSSFKKLLIDNVVDTDKEISENEQHITPTSILTVNTHFTLCHCEF